MMQWQPVMFTQFCILSQIMNVWINKFSFKNAFLSERAEIIIYVLFSIYI